MSTPTFVVGTGRCGSTMLSNMLREHPKVLSLSEFFAFVSDGGRSEAAFSARPLDGRGFWEILATIQPLHTFAMTQDIEPPEVLYSYESPSARFNAQSGVPAILLTTLPHLTDDHDHLFDLLHDEVVSWREGTVGEHYRHLFEWLSAHFGKRLWVERSGASFNVAEQLRPFFPEAKIVHMVRDGRDAALSNQAHFGFRLAMLMISLQQALGVDPLANTDRTRLDRVPADLRPFLPEKFDVEAFRAHRIPLPLCGGLWAHQMQNGARALRGIAPDRMLTLRYEDFFVDAKQQLDALTAFLGEDYVDEDWSARCSATVRQPKSTWRDLPEEDARALTEACRPGFEALRAAGVDYEI